MDKGNFKLVVVYDKRVISIPFKSIKLIDEFTSYYSNMQDIGVALNEILDLKLKNVLVKRIYIAKNRQDNNEYIEELSIKYNFDNYDYEDVAKKYFEYLIKNKEILNKKGTVLNIIMINYLSKYNKIYLTDEDIKKITLLYLKYNDENNQHSNYNNFRTAYFTLLRNGYSIKKVKVSARVNSANRTDLTKYNPEDEYLEYLISRSKVDEEEKAEAIDAIAKYLTEEEINSMSNANYSLFDNQDIKRSIEDEALLLQALTNMSTEELIELINNNPPEEKNKSRGKK